MLEDVLRHYVNPHQNNGDNLLAFAEFVLTSADHSVFVWLSSKHFAMTAVSIRKLLPRWLGPLQINSIEVTADNGPVMYRLAVSANCKVHRLPHQQAEACMRQ